MPSRLRTSTRNTKARGSRAVTRCDPPRVLSYTWGEHSEVTFELSPQGDDVLLVLTHRRLPDRTAMVMAAAAGTPISRFCSIT